MTSIRQSVTLFIRTQVTGIIRSHLTATNSMGSSTKTRIEYITIPGFLLAPPNEPVVNFTATPTYGSVPLLVQFTDLSTGFVDPVSYLWDFGDGGTSTVRNASHTFTTPGYHTVSLTVTGNDGHSESEIKPGYINTEIPFIELTLIEEPLGSSLPSGDTTTPTQSTSGGQSLSMAESALESQSLPVMQSVAPGKPEYQQSIPVDRSFQNNLALHRTDSNTNP